MNRRYTADEFCGCVNILRKYFDKPAITTDVIVGFPGETQEEFETTKAFLTKIRFYELHVFKYSRRKGTAADRMPEQVSEDIKTLRSNELLALDEELSAEYRRGYIGKTVSVLTEETVSIDGKEYMTGFTDTYVKTAIPLDGIAEVRANSIVKVRIDKLMGKDLVIGVAEN